MKTEEDMDIYSGYITKVNKSDFEAIVYFNESKEEEFVTIDNSKVPEQHRKFIEKDCLFTIDHINGFKFTFWPNQEINEMNNEEDIKKEDYYTDYVNFVMDSMYKEDLENWLKQQQVIQTINNTILTEF